MRAWSYPGLVFALALGAGLTGCKPEGAITAKPDPNSIHLDIVEGPEGTTFAAAVEFERVGATPKEAVRSERELAGGLAVLLKPVKLISGQWDLTRTVFLEGSLYLASMPESRFLGILVKDAKGQPHWFTEFVINDGKIYEGGTAELAGSEADAAKIVANALAQSGVAIPR